MPVTINVNDLTLCHKDSGGMSVATLPDVCKTPPGVAIPYPNIAFSSDLVKGTATVTADGGNMCANYGSEFSKSTGDEPGTLGGVKSGTFIKEASWLTFSFDVKLEGKPACRLTDKMWHNHMNTVNAAGEIQMNLVKNLLQKMLCDCDKEVRTNPPKSCMDFGNKLQECVEKKKDEHNRSGKKPKLQGEKGYNKKTGKPHTNQMPRRERFGKLAELRGKIKTARQALDTAKAAGKRPKMGRGGLILSILEFAAEQAAERALNNLLAGETEISKELADSTFPDGAVLGEDGKIEQFFEYKAQCPEGLQAGTGISRGTTIPSWSDGQLGSYTELIASMKKNDPGAIAADAAVHLLTSADC